MQPAEAEFVESFALRLSEAGMQRMAARIFAALLIAPAGGLTARQIADVLGVSAGAVSGATRTLTQTGLADRRRTPGERSDRFEVRGTSWAESMLARSELIRSYSDAMSEGIAVTDDPGALERLQETRDFFDFLATELPRLVESWRRVRDSPS